MEIHQFRVVIRARNFERSCRFYGEVMALPQLRSWDREDSRGALFQAGAGVVEVLGRPGVGGGDFDEEFDYQGPRHKMTLLLTVPSPEKAYEELIFREKNIPGGLRQDVDGAMIFETHDPDGVKIVLRQSSR